MDEADKHTLIVDRLEDNGWTVLERDDGLTFNIPSVWLPKEAQEGHVVHCKVEASSQESSLHFTIDAATTNERLEKTRALRALIPQASEGGIDL